MAFEDICNTILTLGSDNFQSHDHRQHKNNFSPMRFDQAIPSLTLGLLSEEEKLHQKIDASNSLSVVSSYSHSSVKRERELSVEEAEEGERVCSKVSSDVEEGMMSASKKLRLTKEQSLVLEDSFKERSTLNPRQKQALAKQLNLRPRQVEVWFQNRRARTKLKQTEVESELLKKHWETLTVENRRLQKELQELKATTPSYMQYLPAAATHTMCPSCETIGGGGGGGDEKYPSKSAFSMGANKPHFYKPFTHPSAAC